MFFTCKVHQEKEMSTFWFINDSTLLKVHYD